VTTAPIGYYLMKKTIRPHVMDGLDPAIGYPGQIANDAIPVSSHPMEMTGLILGSGTRTVMTGLDRCARYVNSKVRWYNAATDHCGYKHPHRQGGA
jgi:hypothetical protein